MGIQQAVPGDYVERLIPDPGRRFTVGVLYLLFCQWDGESKLLITSDGGGSWDCDIADTGLWRHVPSDHISAYGRGAKVLVEAGRPAPVELRALGYGNLVPVAPQQAAPAPEPPPAPAPYACKPGCSPVEPCGLKASWSATVMGDRRCPAFAHIEAEAITAVEQARRDANRRRSAPTPCRKGLPPVRYGWGDAVMGGTWCLR